MRVMQIEPLLYVKSAVFGTGRPTHLKIFENHVEPNL